MSAPTTTVRTIEYGASADQVGDLHLPARSRPPVICLLHGGFWRMPYGRDQMDAIAEDLVSHGFAVWNLEYRRLGASGGGWPGTFDDVAAGVDHLARLTAAGIDMDLDRVAVVGHSAGGHLALWCAAAGRHAHEGAVTRVGVRAAVGLAPVADLARAYAEGVGGEVVEELMGGAPALLPERYRAASPIEMLPLGVRQLILHGTADEAVPIDHARSYARAARAASDPIELIELPEVGHMAHLDPGSEAHWALRRWLLTSVGV